MALLITILFLFLFITGLTRDWDDDFNAFLVFMFIAGLFLTAIFGGLVINGRTIQAKIDMYQSENTKIEEDMNTLVKQYMDYESNTYKDLKGDSSITLVSLYPELKSDKLIEQQLDIYVKNNDKIKTFKEKLINVSNYKWWLYFGK